MDERFISNKVKKLPEYHPNMSLWCIQSLELQHSKALPITDPAITYDDLDKILYDQNLVTIMPLIYAVVYGNKEIVKSLLDSGNNINKRNYFGISALHTAVGYARIDIVKMLLEYGANVNIRDYNGETPLHIAALTGGGLESTDEQEYLMIVRMLLQYGAGVNAQNNKQETPLHMALKYGAEEMAKLLLSSSADPTLRNGEGLTAYDLTDKNIFSIGLVTKRAK